jgi:hypothetical protein
MKGGVILFRGTGAAASRYLESDRSRADDYYLEGGTALAAFTVTDGSGEVLATSELDAEAYAGWVDWIDPLTETSMGKPRLPGEEGTAKHGLPRFAEIVVNTPKSLSVAAALHPDVSDTLDAAQADAVTEIRRFLALPRSPESGRAAARRRRTSASRRPSGPSGIPDRILVRWSPPGWSPRPGPGTVRRSGQPRSPTRTVGVGSWLMPGTIPSCSRRPE